MSRLGYILSVYIYRLVIQIASPFNRKAQLWVRGRKKIWSRMEAEERGTGRLVWFHVASLGEFEQGRPVMEELKRREPETRILLTFFSPSGYEVRKNYPGADYIFYLPMDSPGNARRLIRIFRPDAVVFVKYEFWFYYLWELHRAQVPLYLISAIFRPGQSFFKWWGGIYRQMLRFFVRIFVQDEPSVALLQSIGIEQVEMAGDTRFDRVEEIAGQARKLPRVAEFCAGRPVVVCGSTWPADEEILFNYIRQHPDHWKWIIVPHEIGESHIREILQRGGEQAVRYDSEEAVAGKSVLVIDRIGFLSSVYRYGEIAYIGGGFGQGIHNTLEAAVYSMPVVFGPHYRKFREAVELLEQGGAFTIADEAGLTAVLDSLKNLPAIRETAGREAGGYVERKTGATQKIMKVLTSVE